MIVIAPKEADSADMTDEDKKIKSKFEKRPFSRF